MAIMSLGTRPAPLRRVVSGARPQRLGRAGRVLAAADEGGEAKIKEVIKDGKKKMAGAVANVKENFGTLRTGRATPAMLDAVEVEYYGAPAPLNTIASVSTPDASTLLVKPYDTTALGDIEKALLASDLGITPGNDGEQIRLVVPPMTEERRKELTKMVGKFSEEGKVAIRNVRRDAMKSIQKLEKDGAISKDRLKEAEDDVQGVTDAAIKELEEAGKAKESELMTV